MTSTAIRFDERRLLALLRKEFSQIARDPSTYLIAFVFPLILLFLFGYAVSLDTSRTRIAVVALDSSAPALGLTEAYSNSPYFEVTTARSVEPVRRLMTEGKIRAIIVIPQDFGRGVKQGKAPAIQIVTDGSQPNTASFAAAYGEGVRASWAAAEGLSKSRGARPMLSLSSRFWYNPGLRSRYFLVPGSIAIVMTMIGTLLTALVVAREWERGTMEAMLATPISMAEFIASKVIPYFLLALGSMALCTLIAIFVFGVPFRGSVVALVAIAAAFLLPALGLGLFISAATKNQFVASQIALLTAFLPTFLLSGFLFDHERRVGKNRLDRRPRQRRGQGATGHTKGEGGADQDLPRLPRRGGPQIPHRPRTGAQTPRRDRPHRTLRLGEP